MCLDAGYPLVYCTDIEHPLLDIRKGDTKLNLPVFSQKYLEENIHFWESLLAIISPEFDCVDMKQDGH